MTAAGGRLLLRASAIAIAAAALGDLSIRMDRFDRATIAVVAAAPEESTVARRVGAMLSRDFDVVPGPWPDADATVIAGESLPGDIAAQVRSGRPAFAVARSVRTPAVVIERVEAPRRMPLDAVALVHTTMRAQAVRGRTITVELLSNGVVVDRATRTAVGDQDRMTFTHSAPPAGPGPLALRIRATVAGSTVDSAVADVVAEVAAEPLRVLFHDARPSWMSTFVRRSVERDPRFAVAARTVTSTGVATTAGGPPGQLNDPRLGEYDVVVIGAPGVLDAGDVGALDALLRRRGGTVILLLDTHDGGAYRRLAGASEWQQREGGVVARLAGGTGDTTSLLASEIAWPVMLPAGADRLASDTANRAVIWSSAVGAGRLVVSGALDSWRYRDPSRSSFDAFWVDLIAREASRSVPPLLITASPAVALPGERVEVAVTVRDVALPFAFTRPPSTAPVRVAVEVAGQRVRMLPDLSSGRLVGTVRAPPAEGAFAVSARVAGVAAHAPLVVRRDARLAAGTDRDALDAWIAARGGEVLDEADLARLPRLLIESVAPAPRPVTVYPMRSPWWIVPFAMLLCGEWLLRRRRGLA